jgi:hypothetical protein
VAVAVALAALVCATPGIARADAHADLEKAHNAYVAHRYEEAESRLRALLDPSTGTLKDADGIADARMYLAAVLLAQKRNEEAAVVLDELVLHNRDYTPDPLRVSLEAIDAFTDAQARNKDKLNQQKVDEVRRAQEEKDRLDREHRKQELRLAMLEKLASTEVVIERHSRWLALVPFGVGQFQNGQTADGWLFLVGEGLLAAGTFVAAGFSFYYESKAVSAEASHDTSQGSAYTNLAHWSAVTDDALVGGLVLTMLAGVIHAQATFVPERLELRKREIPAVSVRPFVGPTGIGVAGQF